MGMERCEGAVVIDVGKECLCLNLCCLLFLIRGLDGSKLGIPLSLLQCCLSLGLKSLRHSLLLSDFNLLHHGLHHVKLALDLEIQVAVRLRMPESMILSFCFAVWGDDEKGELLKVGNDKAFGKNN